ncbi:lauroyl acyltransferase [Ralstonia solanacearum]|uniref:lipid A biosynthesis lauroyl acyltransferase n=2 Tax=Ralstonia solanacearum TaxID=305 RepID=UPI0001816F49|nr:lipid A biosynthesis lauroyl acyltransferase [Ralstonia solanacearum]MDC6178376.1 lipid A biosynthesis lauroyl acyltransferase [Ralstonia solanacearum]MDC6210824.1 lipid A biosynthesis lauroyl acyltransferase [Ralstonia solanacearum]MDC6239435.1 lipid A biosynthesis lauroyl acyltransferase [Ralstonia solanacearum]MDD7801306.1 lipid A biosynthesis lauroyl acyltransferase [Ralstonia solanacearum]TYZ54354.1 lauroyl acyltransferase [Ralstonia solanacearum]
MERFSASLGLGFLWLLSFLPYGFVARFGEGLGGLLYRIPSSRRRVVLANLKACFPEMPDAEREAAAHEVFRKVFRSFAERSFAWFASEKRLRRVVTIDDQANLPALHGAPHILVTLHLSGVEIGALALTDYLREHVGNAGCSLYTRMANPALDDAVKALRSRFGATMVSRNENIRQIMRTIKRGEALQLISDMDFGERDAEFVPFFGVPALTLNAIPRMAALTGAKVVPMYTEILPDYQGYALRILPPWDHYPTGDLTADTRRMNAFFEDVIRPRITEYYWVHKRFKHRPPGEPGLY